jgi:hemin uptake protein HemP
MEGERASRPLVRQGCERSKALISFDIEISTGFHENEVASHLQIETGYVESSSQVRASMPGTPAKRPTSPNQPLKRIAVSDLLGGRREAVLLHDGDEYRLRLTSNGKLILTK